MVKVITAENAGFCFGVKRAVETVYEEAKKQQPVYTFGPIIHNDVVVRDLEKKGVRVIHSVEEAAKLTSGTVIIRSHGVSKETLEALKANTAIHVVDATCPFVQRIHDVIAEQSAAGRKIVIIGNKGHAEVEGHIGWSSRGAEVIETEEEARAFTCAPEEPLCIVAQTTFNAKKFEELVAILNERGYNKYVMNTICNATSIRQEEARRIASAVDIMIVIGGKNSSNSAKLFDICSKECDNTFFIETREDLELHLTGSETVGITAGASTPNIIIEEVQSYVRT